MQSRNFKENVDELLDESELELAVKVFMTLANWKRDLGLPVARTLPNDSNSEPVEQSLEECNKQLCVNA